MKNFKSILCAFVVLLMGAFMFVGCNDKDKVTNLNLTEFETEIAGLDYSNGHWQGVDQDINMGYQGTIVLKLQRNDETGDKFTYVTNNLVTQEVTKYYGLDGKTYIYENALADRVEDGLMHSFSDFNNFMNVNEVKKVYANCEFISAKKVQNKNGTTFEAKFKGGILEQSNTKTLTLKIVLNANNKFEEISAVATNEEGEQTEWSKTKNYTEQLPTPDWFNATDFENIA